MLISRTEIALEAYEIFGINIDEVGGENIRGENLRSTPKWLARLLSDAAVDTESFGLTLRQNMVHQFTIHARIRSHDDA